MIVEKKLIEEVQEIRNLITKPTLKTPEEAKAYFLTWLLQRHGVDGNDNVALREWLKKFSALPAFKNIFSYMGFSL